MAYGLTPLGFTKKSLQTIKSEMEAVYKNTYGDDLDVSEDSVAGQQIGNLSKKFANMWDMQEAVYNSFSPDKGEGVSLDGAAALVGIERLPALSTEVYIMLQGTAATVVPINHLVSQVETLAQFFLFSNTIIDQTASGDITFSVDTVLDTQLYEITINTTTFSYTSDGTATAEEIVAGLIADIAGGSEPVTTVDNLDGTGRIYATDGRTSFDLTLDINLALDSLATPGRYIASIAGPASTPVGTITTIVNPVSGLSSISNIDTGTIGRDVEVDEALRTRRRDAVQGIGNATDEAIRTHLLEDVGNVSTVTVISNRTDGVVSGRPAHSFETIITGGDDQEIADKIWVVQPSGIQPYGTTTESVVDSEGNPQSVGFTRPTFIPIWVVVSYSLYSEEVFPNDGVVQIKDAIVEFSLEEYSTGTDVIRQRLAIPIYTVPGVGEIEIEVGFSSGSESAVNLSIADDEIATFDTTRIVVNLV